MDKRLKVRERKKEKKRYSEQVYDSYDSEEQERERHFRMSSSRRSRTVSRSRNLGLVNYSRSRSRSPRNDLGLVNYSRSRSPRNERRCLSQSPKKSQTKNKMEEIETTYPEYYCEVCDCSSSGELSFHQHIVGKRHIKNTEKIMPDFGASTRRYLIEKETEKRLLLKEKLIKFDRRKTEYACIKEYKRYDDASQIMGETDQEDDFCVDLEYILVIRKEGKSAFHCVLCDTYAVYKNSQQLVDHARGISHQRAYKEENKNSIRFRRNPGKHSKGEWVEQPNVAERISKKLLRNPHTSQLFKDSKRSKRIRSSSEFLRRHVKQACDYNKRYNKKLVTTKRKLEDLASRKVSSKNSTPTAASPSSASSASFSSCNDIAAPDNGISSPELPETSNQTLSTLLESVEKLSTADISKLLLLKLENVEVQKQDLPYLDSVAEQTTVLSNKLKKADTTLQKENLDVQRDSTPIVVDISSHSNSEQDITAGQDETLHLEGISASPAPSLEEAINLSSSGNKSIDLEVITKVHEESSPVSSTLEQSDQLLQPPASFWNSLPSTQDLENFLGSLPSLNLSKNSDGFIEITLN